jgi:hypothetical protein
MEDDVRLISSQMQPPEVDAEYRIRPLTLDEYTGQKQTKDNISVFIHKKKISVLGIAYFHNSTLYDELGLRKFIVIHGTCKLYSFRYCDLGICGSYKSFLQCVCRNKISCVHTAAKTFDSRQIIVSIINGIAIGNYIVSCAVINAFNYRYAVVGEGCEIVIICVVNKSTLEISSRNTAKINFIIKRKHVHKI